MKNIIGIKKGMTQIYKDDKVVPVTVVEISENIVCGVDKAEKNCLIRIGTGKKKKPTKAEIGTYKEVKFVPKYTWDVRYDLDSCPKIGDKFGPDVLKEGDFLRIVGITKAKGFAGVVKRWGFRGGPKTHGQSDRLRAPGSIGAGTSPGRIIKGKKMAGKMGGTKQTLINKRIVEIGNDYVLIRGQVPGNVGGLLKISVMSSNEG